MLIAPLFAVLCALPLSPSMPVPAAIASAGPALVSAPAVAAPARLGPPLLCFPIDVGGRATLPASDRSLALEDVLPATQALLGGSDAIVVHMETLRRAVLRLQGDDRLGKLVAVLAEASRGAERATSALSRAGLLPDADLLAHAARARFDLAYVRAAAAEAGLRTEGLDRTADDLALVRKALPQDGSLALGCALISFSVSAPDAVALHLQDAVIAARSGEPGLEANLLSTFGVFLSQRSLDGLAAWAASRTEQV